MRRAGLAALALLPLLPYLPFLNLPLYGLTVYLPALRQADWRDPFALYMVETLSLAEGSYFQGGPWEMIRYFRPLLPFVLFLEQRLFGTWAPGYRLFNLGLHLGIAGLIYALGRRHGAGRRTAVAASLIFALHPSRAWSLIHVLNLPTIMATLGSALSLWWMLSAKGQKRWVPASLFAFTALLSKETAFLLPAILIVSLGRRSELKGTALMGLTWLLYVFLRVLFRATFFSPVSCPPYVVTPSSPSFAEQVGRTLSFCLSQLLWLWPPAAEMVNIHATTFGGGPFYPAAVGLGLGLTAAAYSLWRLPHDPLVRVGLVGSALSFLPLLLTAPSLNQLYFPGFWLSLWLAGLWRGSAGAAVGGKGRQAGLVLAGAYLSACIWQTVAFNAAYRDRLAVPAETFGRALQQEAMAPGIERLWLVNVPEPLVVGLAHTVRANLGREALEVYALSYTDLQNQAPAVVFWKTPSALVVRREQGLFATPMERFYFCGEVPAGTVLDAGAFAVETPAGEAPYDEIEVAFREPLSSSTDLILVWDPCRRRFERVNLP